MNPAFLKSSDPYRLLTINLGPKQSPSASPVPPPTRNQVECLIHLVAAVALGVFGLLSLCIGVSIMSEIGITAPIGILLVSAGLIMLCIGLPERYRDVQKLWAKEHGSRKTQ